MAPATSTGKSTSGAAGKTAKAAAGSTGYRSTSQGDTLGDAVTSKATSKSAKGTKSTSKARARSAGPEPIDDKAFRKSLETPETRTGADENTAFARNRDAAPPTQTEMQAEAQAEAQTKADRVFKVKGRVNDFADSPSEKIAPRTAFPHPFTGTQVDRTGGIAEITHKAGVYGMDSRDYGSRLIALGQAIGIGEDGSMDPRDRWTRLVALHDLLINAARYGNAVTEEDDIVAQAGLATGGRKGGGYKSNNVTEVLAQVGLLPGDL